MKKNITKAILFMSAGTFWTIIVSCVFATTLLAGSPTSAQSIRDVVIKVEYKDATLLEVFDDIETKTSFKFLYRKSAIKYNSKRVNIKPAKASVAWVLQNVSRQTGVSFRQINSTIAVNYPDTSEPVNGKVQTSAITGRVTDAETGEPMPGASIFVEGTTKGAATNAEGKYTIENVETGTYTLRATFVGYQPQEKEVVVLEDDTVIVDFQLQRGANWLGEVKVVSTGYQQISKERAAGSYATIGNEELDKQIGAIDIRDKLQGMLPGVLLTNSDGITIRGKSTLNANPDPLIVVDGFATELSLASINPNDIETITVLKDAAAASIWGVRASNGVIVIATKDGPEGRQDTRFSYSSTVRSTEMPDVSSLKLANAEQYINAELEALNKGWYNLDNPNGNSGYSRVYEVYRKQNNGEITAAEAEELYNQLRNNNSHGQTDLFFQDGLYHQHNLSASGATEKNKYYLSLNYQSNDSYQKTNNDNRLKFRVKNSFQFHPKLRFDASISLSYIRGHNNGISMYEFVRQRPYTPFVDGSGAYVPAYSSERSYQTNEEFEAMGYYDWNENLKRDFDNNDNTSNSFTPRINTGIHFDVIEGLSLDSKFMYERNNYTYDEYLNEEMYYTRDLINKFTIIEGGEAVYQLPRGMIYNTISQNLSSYSIRNQINFDRSFNNDLHEVNAILGSEFNRIKTDRREERYYGFDKDKLTYSLVDYEELAAGVPNWQGSTQSLPPIWKPVRENEDRYLSFYFNGSYSYAGKYTFITSARIDQSNLFGANTNDRLTPLYSLGVAYNISREPFFNVGFIDNMVLRATMGESGNVDKETSKVLIAEPAKNSSSTQEDYLKIEFPENKDLKWETTKVYNVGLDVAAFGRLSIGLDLYMKKSFDLLGLVEADPTVGFTNVYKNTSEVENKGFELNINADILNKQFGWNVNLNLSHNRNEVTKLYNPNPSVNNYLTGGFSRQIEGKPIDYIYNYRWAGLSDAGEPQVYDNEGNVISWQDNTDTPALDWLVYSGSTTPQYFGSLTNTFRYKGFTLTPIITYQLGHVMRLPSPYIRGHGHVLSVIDQRWREPGDEVHTDIPKMHGTINSPYKRRQFFMSTDHRTKSASYIRLNSVSFTYDLPASLIGGYFRSIQLQAQATNLWQWHKNDKGIDPEAINLRYGDLSLEPPITYTFGLNVNF